MPQPYKKICMRTLYNNGRQGESSIKLTKLPEALKQKATSQHEKENKEALRKSSSNRPGSQSFRIEEGHSEGDIAVGKMTVKRPPSFLEKIGKPPCLP